ncbi:sigma-70 family RNA polymerase sigma factor [Oceanobacillus halotolerans]|uniref:sigma-70 family RNA polymerase sigma factor n=1 Tax=Oceanobacillus halotolerans TaxID=2663380 RepID=UPI0013D680F7|nr:sigma-70 family RNA polymerase sigma factor [Oceanobacillus halotolerans]
MDENQKDIILEDIMIKHGDELVRLANHYVNDQETAKDIVQNTFIKCYEKLDSFRYESSLKTWLYRITINGCKDYLKSWHHRKVQLKQSVQDAVKTIFPSTEDKYIRESKNRVIRDVVLALPQHYREVLYLYYYESLKIHEIAGVTEVKESTVKTRLRRGKVKLKNRLEEVGIDG